MNDNINGYILIGEFRTDNSGSARWGFARRDGQEVFIKEFLSPVYPVETSVIPPNIVKSRIKLCENYVASKRKLYDSLNKCNTGNVVGILDFFRFGAKYYIITEKINSISLTMEEISKMSIEQKHLICKIIIYCVKALHDNHIVHCDIKHDNILFKKTASGKYVAKLIDFDASFLEDDPPSSDDELHGDMVYYAPESVKYMMKEINRIDTKVDVFALGLLFHQYFTGELPYFDLTSYDYAFEAVLDDCILVSDESIPHEYAVIINDMLKANPNERPNLSEVFEQFAVLEQSTNVGNNSTVKLYAANETKSAEEKSGFHIAGDL